jgi:hypothetical protein
MGALTRRLSGCRGVGRTGWGAVGDGRDLLGSGRSARRVAVNPGCDGAGSAGVRRSAGAGIEASPDILFCFVPFTGRATRSYDIR